MKYDDCIKESIDYIELNLNNKIKLKELADNVFLAQYYFHRIFHAAVGESVAEYIRNRRLNEAADELLNTNNKIVDIALKYQFSSQEVFTKAFKKLYGIPPRKFRMSKNKITSSLSMAA